MFLRSIQWRLIFIIIALTFVLISVIWVFLNFKVEGIFYEINFKKPIQQGLNSLSINEEMSFVELIDRLVITSYSIHYTKLYDACPFGAPQFPKNGAFGTKGKMDKCTMCAGGPEETNSHEEFEKYGQNRISEGKVPMCASMCSTKALLVGDANEVALIKTYRAVV